MDNESLESKYVKMLEQVKENLEHIANGISLYDIHHYAFCDATAREALRLEVSTFRKWIIGNLTVSLRNKETNNGRN